MRFFSLESALLLICLLVLPAAGHPTEVPGTLESVASSNTPLEPRITHPPTINTLKYRDNSEGQSFIGYYYFDGSWQTTDCGTQTFGVSSLLGYCCTNGTSCDHPTACSSGYVLGPQGPFVCEGSGYTCGSAFLAPSLGGYPMTTIIQCYPPNWTLTSWYRIEDSQESASSSSSVFLATDSLSTLFASTSSATPAGTITQFSTSYTSPTLPTSPTMSPTNTNRLQKSSETATIAGTVVGFASLVATLIFGIHQWKRRKGKHNI